ncbi:hypothetical protein AcV7_001839 [Taiwanofungus camphoratus]|nr:hypothetical protein AcV7_001839 [Antrodia cinnamomea]
MRGPALDGRITIRPTVTRWPPFVERKKGDDRDSAPVVRLSYSAARSFAAPRLLVISGTCDVGYPLMTAARPRDITSGLRSASVSAGRHGPAYRKSHSAPPWLQRSPHFGCLSGFRP